MNAAPSFEQPVPGQCVAVFGRRRYEVCAMERTSPARLRATIKAVDAEAGRFHIDTVELYVARSRKAFVAEAAQLLSEKPATIEADLQRLIKQVEAQAKQRAEASPGVVVMSEEDETAGRRLGRHPELIAQILGDLDGLGLVGEVTNKLVSYIAMTSRKMADPLSLQILSGSGAGKSHLQDAILALCPDEDLIKLTALTGQALFYKEPEALKHKVLALEEERGARGADYAIRNLISSKRLVIESTVRNAGRLETQSYVVHGPVAVFQTTTQPDTDPETKSRFLLTSVDESPAQTKAILEAQRNRHTLEGMLAQRRRAAIVARHQAFQRLLKPHLVVNPYEPLLRFGTSRLAERRDHPKYLNLILAITFLHQMQRPVRHHPELGDYIETTLDDIAMANELAVHLFGHGFEELSQPGRTLLQHVFEHVSCCAKALQVPREEVTFTRRQLRESLGWSEYQLRVHIGELVRLEYVAPLRGRQGQLYSYRLLWDGKASPSWQVQCVEQLRQEAKMLGIGSGRTAKSSKFEGTSLRPAHEAASRLTASHAKRNGRAGKTSRTSSKTTGGRRK